MGIGGGRLGRKLTQLDYGLRGQIADGMLVRVSSFGAKDEEGQFALQQRFLSDLYVAMPLAMRGRYFGT